MCEEAKCSNDLNTFKLLGGYVDRVTDWCVTGRGFAPRRVQLRNKITIEENTFITKIYHKVDDFDFEVVSFPFPTSNMSDHITYNSFYSQLVRLSSVCSKFNDFDIRSGNLLESLLYRGFSKYRLKNSFNKFVLNHHDVLDIKYSMEEINEFIRSHFS